MPVFALFFPVHVAVAETAVVHGANNIFKLLVVARHANRELVLRFGIPAILAAFAGVAIGKHFLHKVSMPAMQTLTGIFPLLIAVCPCAGIAWTQREVCGIAGHDKIWHNASGRD